MKGLIALMALSAPLAQSATPQLSFPVQWDILTPLPYRVPPQITAKMVAYVRHEMAASNCPDARRAGDRREVTVDVAVLVGVDGKVRATIPHAIDCPTVEQYSAGLVTGFARNNLDVPEGGGAGWYRATVAYSWQG